MQKKKKLLAKIFCIFECLLTQNPTNQDSQLSWFFQKLWKVVRKSKTGGFWELFLLEMIAELAPQNFFQKNIQILEAWKPAGDMKFRLDFSSHALLHMNSIWKLFWVLQGYLHYKTITSQNVISEAQVKNFLFCRKVMFHYQDIQVFVFLAIPLFTKTVTSWWILVH